MVRVSIIGKGNVAYHFYKAFSRSDDVKIDAIVTRSQTEISWSQSAVVSSFDLSLSQSDIFILAVNDHSIANVLQDYRFPDKAIVVHTAGAIGMEVFEKVSFRKYGVIYPLQTLSKRYPVHYDDLPVFLEASDSGTQNLIEKCAKAISKKVALMDSQQRLNAHVAAVFACNFVNHLFSISEDILTKNNLRTDLLHPLIDETIRKFKERGAFDAQTGPALRNDQKTMLKHLETIKDEELKNLYVSLSDQIMEAHDISAKDPFQ